MSAHDKSEKIKKTLLENRHVSAREMTKGSNTCNIWIKPNSFGESYGRETLAVTRTKRVLNKWQ